MISDPIIYFYHKFGFDPSSIKELVHGAKYVGILLQNGQIGVCVTIGRQLSGEIHKEINLNNIEHRIILNAYFNAKLNYSIEYKGEMDICEAVDFKQFQNIVMVGNFKSIVKRFKQSDIPFTVFDKEEDDLPFTPMKKQLDYIKKADAIILTGTSIYNATFEELLRNSNTNCNIFLLGPSCILHPDIKVFRNVKGVFGSVFERNDNRVLETIKLGFGTKHFSQFSRKVYI